MNVADRIQNLRKMKGISQEQLADAIGVSRQAISKWESGQSTPDLEKIILMSDFFDVTTDYLIKGIEPTENDEHMTVGDVIDKKILTAKNEKRAKKRGDIMKTYLGSIAAIFALILSQIAVELIGSLLHMAGLQTGFCNIIAGVMYPLFTYSLLKLLANILLKTDVKKFGMPHIEIKMKWLIIAFVLPVAVKSVFLLMPGEFVSSGMDNHKIFATLSAGIVFTGFAAGFAEEMVFRGIIMGLLKERWDTKVAIIVPSVLFASVHLIGMNFTVLSCVLVLIAGTMVGVMFSLITLESNSVWNSGIVHAIWNIVIIGGGLSIGEIADEYSVMTYVLKSKSFALTGGEFGIESSVIAIAGYAIVAITALVMINKNDKFNRSICKKQDDWFST